LDPTEELFLLALHLEKPAHPNHEYVAHLATYYGTVVSTTFTSEWFKTQFDHK
jgi:cystathionine beta-lyase/cystathionine gamma-synthase